MIAGHFGFAASVKGVDPAVPTWALMLASVWLDIVFLPLFGAGIERMVPLVATNPGAYGGAVIYADYTHSLVGAVLLSMLFGGAAALRYGRRSGVVLAVVAFSHWVLDLPMHRADMPLLPGNAGDLPRWGFGLWQYPVAAVALELALVMLGAVLYGRAAMKAAGGDASRVRRARICTAMIVIAGLVTLGLGLAGV